MTRFPAVAAVVGILLAIPAAASAGSAGPAGPAGPARTAGPAGPAGSAAAGPLDGSWEGALRFRGADLPVRLHVDGRAATLDVPALLMAGESVAAAPVAPAADAAPADGLRESNPDNAAGRVDEAIDLELPFGLGALTLTAGADSAEGSRELNGAKAIGEDTLTLALERASPPPYAERDVRFESGGIELAGTLLLPSGPGPHPGIALLHGSGRTQRATREYRGWADFLAREGFAVLFWDKRGVGASGGEYGSDLRQLAADGAAALRLLRSRPEVDAARVGLHGWSQGAWLAERIAADERGVAFLLLVAAAAGTPREQELQKIEYGLRADGRPEAEIEDALAYAGLYFYVARTGEGWPLLHDAARAAAAAPWGGYVEQPRTEADLAWWRANHDFQPAVAVAGLELPALLLYGGADWIVPPAENADKLRGLFPEAAQVVVRSFEGADHRLEVPMGHDDAGRWRWPGIAPGALDLVRAWLRVLQE